MKKYDTFIRWISRLMLAAFCVLPAKATADADSSAAAKSEQISQSIEVLRTRLDETRTILKGIQELEREWAEDKSLLEQGKETRERDIEALKEDIEKSKTAKATDDKETAENAERRRELEEAMEFVEDEMPRYEKHLRKIAKWFPDPLKSKISQNLNDLVDEEKLKKVPISQRVQLLIKIITEAEKFQNSVVPAAGEMRAGSDGRERLVDTVYYGMAIAFSISPEGSASEKPLALIGRPASGGWVFEERSDIVPKVRKLVALGLNRGGEPAIVQVPAKIESTE